MDQFWEEFEAGEIHFRDRWQFELKSEFQPQPQQKQSEYLQEFFIFVPNSLQIKPDRYFKEDFYRAQTNLIRFKTPEISFKELINPSNPDSPLEKLRHMQYEIKNEATLASMEFELKLFASIWKSNLRKRVYPLIIDLQKITDQKNVETCKSKIENLLQEVDFALKKFEELKSSILKQPCGSALDYILGYIQDTLSLSLNSSMSSLLNAVRHQHLPLFAGIDSELSTLLLREKSYRKSRHDEFDPSDTIQNEALIYKRGLLNKFIIEALQLQTRRLAIGDKYRSLIGSFAAALAMLIYILLFIWQGALFVINSLPFVIFTVLIYVLKDRLKEELKNVSYRRIFRWYPDYTTEIRSPDGKFAVGRVQESFTFIHEKDIPLDAWRVRNKGHHTNLNFVGRPEQIIHYKKKITINKFHSKKMRLNSLSIIFRCDIHSFLLKASEPYESYTEIDSETLDLIPTLAPKVYHINIVLKNSYRQPDLTEKVEWKKCRIVADKEGIKRIESDNSP